MSTARRIGLLGGTFDPVHLGHTAVADAAIAALALDEVLLLTSPTPPHRPPPAAPLHHRFAMVALAIQDRPAHRASDLELSVTGPSYTRDTLGRLHGAGYAASQLFFLIGADAFAEIATWRGYPGVLEAAHFVVVNRPGHPVDSLYARLGRLADRMERVTPGEPPSAAGGPGTRVFLVDAPTPEISSTTIRARCAEGRSIAGLVAPAVERHIVRHGLYAAGEAGDTVTPSPCRAASLLHEQDQP
jgi:nicotinate-nucleotide adenylyltransferase